jgi:hypothetical protein
VLVHILFVRASGTAPGGDREGLATTEEIMSAARHEIGPYAPAPAAVPHPVSAPVAAPSLGRLLSRRTAAEAVHALQEPTFDELVGGHGRHRGSQDPEASASGLRRLALRARLLPTPPRRTAARATGTP